MKFFLKCEHCGNLNEVNTEFLTFCDSCSKKLALNYRDWKKKNRDATLDEYKAQVCESEVLVAQEINAQSANIIDDWKHWIGISKTIAVIIGLALFFLPVYLSIQDFNYSLEASAYANVPFNPNWEYKTFGSFGLNAESPVELILYDLTIPDQSEASLEVAESFRGGLENERLMIMFNSFKYAPSIGGVNMEGAANGSVEAMKSSPGISKLTYSQKKTSVSGIPGYRQDGSYYQNGIKSNFTYVGVGQGLVMWQIIVAHQSDIGVFERAAQRIINSLEIKFDSSN